MFSPPLTSAARRRITPPGVLILLALLAAPAGAQWHVAPGGSDNGSGSATAPFATIQRALDIAVAGEEVLLGDGDYLGPGNRRLEFRGKDITVRSRSGRREDVRVHAEGSDGFLFFTGETNAAVLADLSVIGAARGIVVERASPRIVNCLLEACGVGIDVSGTGARIEMERCLARGGGTGARIHGDAQGGLVTGSGFRDNSGPGVATADYWTAARFGSLRFVACELIGNDGDGLLHAAPAGSAELVDCEVADNGGWGVMSINPIDRGVAVYGGIVRGNGAGGINTASSQWDIVHGCKVHDNGGPGIFTSRDAIHSVRECLVRDNAGDGIAIGNLPTKAAKSWQPVIVADCVIYGNEGSGIAFGAGPHHDNLVTGTLIYRNQGPGIRVATPVTAGPTTRILVRESTLAHNAAGVQVETAVRMEFERTLIAFNLGAALDCAVAPDVTLACSDLFGNGGGDWTGPIAGQASLDGNLCVDPRFCDDASDDFHLLSTSLCATAGDCGRVGALGVGCTAPATTPDRRGVTALALDPCRPNPFNPSTTIRLAMPESGSARLEVFDLAGRRVRTLLTGHLDAGPHAVVWDGRDDHGLAAGAGIYLARLEAGGLWRTTRMTLVK